MARVYTIDVVTSASQSPISRQRVEQANRVLGWPDGGFLLWLKRQLSACLFKPSQCQLCEILAILPPFFFPPLPSFSMLVASTIQAWWKTIPSAKQCVEWIFFVRIVVYLPPKSKISEFMMQANLIFKQMGKYIAFKYYLKGGLCKNLVVSPRLKL